MRKPVSKTKYCKTILSGASFTKCMALSCRAYQKSRRHVPQIREQELELVSFFSKPDATANLTKHVVVSESFGVH
jgi:hypothetical protein